ncbi:MAG TPA: tetratricopeptide repeat protein, partial [Gemmatimonadaceae bacterium]|nr:tetratricopeptide repeat protein [Gemmatimonadaceae bacterium]
MSRLDSLRALVQKNPSNPLARFGLAIEEEKEGQLAEARANFEAYLAAHDDEGNGWQRLADVRRRLGDVDGAREALQRGMDAARRFGHPSMV